MCTYVMDFSCDVDNAIDYKVESNAISSRARVLIFIQYRHFDCILCVPVLCQSQSNTSSNSSFVCLVKNEYKWLKMV